MNTLILAQGLPVNETLSNYSDLAFRTAFGIYVLALIASLIYYAGFRVAKVSQKELVAAGLFLAPVIGGHEPKFQRLGVNVLFGALLLVVVGSLAGEYLAIHQVLPLDLSFWLGHQGYEYVDLGRVWQIALFVGLYLASLAMAPSGAEFAGTDAAANDLLDVEPWFKPLFSPGELGGELESGLFALQAGLGGIVFGFVLGRLSGRRHGAEDR